MFGTKRAEEVKAVCPRGNLANPVKLRDAALLPKQDHFQANIVHRHVRPKQTISDIICESFINYTDSNFGAVMGLIIFEYARPPTDREKLVWILEDKVDQYINFNCSDGICFSYLSLMIAWNHDKDSTPYSQRKYIATIQFRGYVEQRVIYFDDLLPTGRAETILTKIHSEIPEYVSRIKRAYTKRMRKLYAKY